MPYAVQFRCTHGLRRVLALVVRAWLAVTVSSITVDACLGQAIDAGAPPIALSAVAAEPREPALTRDEVERIVAEYLAQREAVRGASPTGFMNYEQPLVPSPAPSPADEAPADGLAALRAEWTDFLANAKKTGYPNVVVNGAFQADVGFFNQDRESLLQYGRIQDGADFRRARLSAGGAVTENVSYFFQMDFAFFGRPTFTDVWMETTDLPVLGKWRIGQWKQPFSLEVVSSYRYTTFMERSVLFIPFTPFRHIGTGFQDYSEDLSRTWAASVFRAGNDHFGDSISTDGGWATAERTTWLPYYDEASNGRYYLHLGAGHHLASPPHDRANFRTIPEFFIGENAPGVIGTAGIPSPGPIDGTPFFVATGPLRVNMFNVLGSELLWVRGPFSLQSEAMVNFLDQIENPDATLWGFYAQIGYFLTGEHRPYDRATGAIERIIPFENFFRVGTPHGACTGRGAWEVAARWSYLDLNSRNIAGGTLNDVTLGVNWYWNPHSKLVFNYIRAMPDLPGTGTSDTNIFGMRAQIDF